MDTTISRRLFSDPDFALLSRELKDPLRAAGALVFIWQGTQQKKLAEATEPELIACFPLGYRGAKSAISACIRTGWLREISTNPVRYEVRGNLKHVSKKAEISEQNRQAAVARWEAVKNAQRMRDASSPHAPASENDAQAMPPSSSSSSVEEGRDRAREEQVPGQAAEKPPGYPYPVSPKHPEVRFVLAKRRELAKQFGRPVPERDSLDDERDAARLVGKYPKRWSEVLAKFYSDPFYAAVGYSLEWLARKAAQVDGRSAPAVEADDSQKQAAVRAQNAAATKKHLDDIAATPESPEVAKAAIDEMRRKFGF